MVLCQPQNEEHEIRALLEARKNAIHNKNVEKTRACFADDAVIFSLAPPLREDSPHLTLWKIGLERGVVISETRLETCRSWLVGM